MSNDVQIAPGVGEDFEPAEEMIVSNFDTLKVIADPTRLRILEVLIEQPLTVKQVARKLEIAPTKLYYHVNLLEERGLLTVTASRVVSGIIEKQYRTTAKNLTIDRSLLTLGGGKPDGGMGTLLSLIFDATRSNTLKAIDHGLIRMEEEEPVNRNAMLAYTLSRLTPEQYRDFYGRLKALFIEFGDAAAGYSPETSETSSLYGITLVMYPLPEADADGDGPDLGQWKMD
jgi:DNA-binding transcriptional ArsR family regulator